MKRMMIALIVALAGFTVNAQSIVTQAVLKNIANCANVVIVSGKLINIATMKPIANAKLNLSKTNGIINAVVDENGNYALALDKNTMNAKSHIEFIIKGYEAISKKVPQNAEFAYMDIRLFPDESQQPVVGKYSMNADPFNSLVMNF